MIKSTMRARVGITCKLLKLIRKMSGAFDVMPNRTLYRADLSRNS